MKKGEILTLAACITCLRINPQVFTTLSSFDVSSSNASEACRLFQAGNKLIPTSAKPNLGMWSWEGYHAGLQVKDADICSRQLL